MLIMHASFHRPSLPQQLVRNARFSRVHDLVLRPYATRSSDLLATLSLETPRSSMATRGFSFTTHSGIGSRKGPSTLTNPRINRHYDGTLNQRHNQAFALTYRLFSSNSVAIEALTLPALSPTMTAGTIAQWKAQPGEPLAAGDVLCEIETDKATVAFDIQDDCVLAKVLVEAGGAETTVGQPIALTVEDAEAYEAFLSMDPADYAHLVQGAAGGAPSTAAASSAASETVSPGAPSVTAPPAAAADTAPVPAPAATAGGGPQTFSPAARHLKDSQALNTSKVTGSGKHGMITKSDLVLALKNGSAVPGSASENLVSSSTKTVDAPQQSVSSSPAAAAAAPVTTPGSSSSAATAPFPSSKAPTTFVGYASLQAEPVNNKYSDLPNNNMRKIIAKRLTESKATVPHFYTTIECEIDALLSLRKTLKKEMSVNVSVNDLVIKSAALALRDMPSVNAKWSAQKQTVEGSAGVDISVAVATPNGLITPIVFDSSRDSLAEINSKVRDLAGRAREGKLKPEEYQGGSFSISNLGMFGISQFSAVINPPQACILAVGSGISKVVPPKHYASASMGGGKVSEGKSMKPRVITTVTVQLSADRRVVDDAMAAQFLQVFQAYLSNPNALLL